MQLTCPSCQAAVPGELVDLFWKNTFCPACQHQFDCGQWIEEVLIPETDLSDPPGGVWFAQAPHYFRVGLQSGSTSPFAPPILFSAMLLLFTLFVAYEAEPESRWREVRFFAFPGLFLLPWWIVAWMVHRARFEVEVKDGSGTLRRSIGPISWERRFDWSRIKKISMSCARTKNQMGHGNRIALEGDEVITFARNAKMERLRFTLIALWRMQREGNTTSRPGL